MKKTHLVVRASLVIGLTLALVLSCAVPVDPPAPAVPAAPDNFNVNGISHACIELRWDDASNNEDNFIIQRADDVNFNLNVTETILDANTVMYRDYNGITAAVTRHYRIVARNGIGDSATVGTISAITPPAPSTPNGSRIADHTVINRIRRGTVPISAIQQTKTDLHIAYGHTSHGSQLTESMSGLVDFANGAGCAGAYSSTPDLFSWNHDGASGALHLFEGSAYDPGDLELDCGYYPSWVDETDAFLGTADSNGRGSNHPEVNVIIWSWCGQASGYSEQEMNDRYLAPMNQFETEYPGVTFVYMTCHLNTADAWTEENLLARDAQIRAYCLANNKWLFDFSDIETYDPDGICYTGRHPNDACNYDFNNNGTTEQDPDTTVVMNGDRNWASDWQNTHTEGTAWYSCGSAHSQPVNANMKAYAAWWLWCRLAGWNGN